MSDLNLTNNIPCPVCKTNIPFDPTGLLKGMKFACPGCQAQIGITNENSAAITKDALEKFEEIKKQKK